MCVLERRRAAAGRSSLTPGIHISLRLSSGFLSFRNFTFSIFCGYYWTCILKWCHHTLPNINLERKLLKIWFSQGFYSLRFRSFSVNLLIKSSVKMWEDILTGLMFWAINKAYTALDKSCEKNRNVLRSLRIKEAHLTHRPPASCKWRKKPWRKNLCRKGKL